MRPPTFARLNARCTVQQKELPRDVPTRRGSILTPSPWLFRVDGLGKRSRSASAAPWAYLVPPSPL